jgi:hypothetical protein
VSRESQ